MRKVCRLVFCCLALGSILSPRAAHAVPAFARREGVPCQMCHFRVPELNEDGHAYLRRGLREEPGGMGAMQGAGEIPAMGKSPPSEPVAAANRPLGEPLSLRWSDYLSVMGHHMFILQRGERPTFDAGVLDLWVGGPLNRNLSGIANPSFDIEESSADVEQAYGQGITRWAAQFGSGRFGQVLPFAILFNGGGPQMPLSEPVVLSTPGGSGNTWTPSTLIRGVEGGFVSLPRWNLYAGVGQPHLESEESLATAMRWRQEGQPGTETSPERHTDLYTSAEYLWGESGNSLTFYGYWGSAWLSPSATDRSFYRLGGFINYYLPQTKLIGGYLAGQDKAPDGRSLDTPGFFVQAEQLLGPQWAAYGRYDWFERDLAAGGTQHINGPTLGVTWWAQTEVRFTLEGQLLSISGSPQNQELMAEFLWIF